jgi:hypothetical protein
MRGGHWRVQQVGMGGHLDMKGHTRWNTQGKYHSCKDGPWQGYPPALMDDHLMRSHFIGPLYGYGMTPRRMIIALFLYPIPKEREFHIWMPATDINANLSRLQKPPPTPRTSCSFRQPISTPVENLGLFTVPSFVCVVTF